MILAAAILGPALFYGSLAAGDFASTEAALGPRTHEVNPLGQTIGARIALKTVGAAAGTFVDVKLQQQIERAERQGRKGGGARTLLWTWRVVYGGVHVWAIWHNVQIANRRQQQ